MFRHVSFFYVPKRVLADIIISVGERSSPLLCGFILLQNEERVWG